MITAVQILVKGFILGLIVSVPLGPIGIILINRTLKRGLWSGFFSGLGLSAADLVQAVIAVVGLTMIISFIREERFILSLAGGIVIIFAGVRIFLSNPVADIRKKDNGNKSLWRDFWSVFLMSVTNPYTVLIFVAFLTGFPLKSDLRAEMVPFILIPGIFIGTMAWWTTVSWVISRFKGRVRLRTIFMINRIAGFVITCIGVILILSLFVSPAL
ncbi:MAG TPA: LysE family transporter [Bacteroidales bacterium]|jgi:threonine/homoserine/homoserine lactone efflux protein|nr:LysE family transporter [Bacteroidales bacterium]